MTHKATLQPMKFRVNQLVEFGTTGGKRMGRIKIADWGGSIEHDCHSYDVFVHEDNMLCKHIPESKISQVDSVFSGHADWREGQRIGFETFDENASEWVSHAGNITAKHWDGEIEEYIFDIEVIIDYDTGETRLFEGVFFEYLMARF